MPVERPIMTRRTSYALAFLLYAFLACLMTFPLIIQIGTHTIGGDTSDTYEMVRHSWWIAHALSNGWDILWQTHLAYPQGVTAFAFFNNLLQYMPPAILSLILPPVLALNIVVLFTLTLNGWAFYAFALVFLPASSSPRIRQTTAIIVGAMFMVSPTFQGHVFDGHTGLIIMYPVVFFLWALLRFLKAQMWCWRCFGWALFWFWLSPSGHLLQVIYVLLPIMGFFWMSALIQRQWRTLWRVTAVGVVGGVMLIVYFLPMIIDTYAQADTYLETTYVRYSMDALAIVSPSFLHPVWGQWLDYPARVLGVNLAEGSSYLGVIGLLLMLVAVWRVPDSRRWAMLWVVAFVLALGPVLKIFDTPVSLTFGDYDTYLTLPLALVQNLPGFNLARTPARFNFTMALAGAMLIAYGLHWLLMRYSVLSASSRRLGVLGVLIVGLHVADVQHFFPMPTRPAPQPQAVVNLRHQPIRAVLDIPHTNLLVAKDALYYQTLHHRPLVGGQITRQTTASPARLNLLEATLDPSLLQEAGVDAVILHKSRITEQERQTLMERARQQLGDPAHEDDQIALFVMRSTLDLPAHDPLPAILYELPAQATTADDFPVDVYTSRIGWLHLSADLSATGREVTLTLDGVTLHRWHITEQTPIEIMLPIPQPDFYRLQFSLQPPCPTRYDRQTLACRELIVQDVRLQMLRQSHNTPVAYEGVQLNVSRAYQVAGDVVIGLWWQMSTTITADAVRFVHILDADGQLVAQDDRHIGVFEDGDQWAEAVRISLPELPPGVYHVAVGWYDYDTLTRWRVLDADLIGADVDAPNVTTFIID